MMQEDWVECKFEDLLDYEQPTKYIIKDEEYNDKYAKEFEIKEKTQNKIKKETRKRANSGAGLKCIKNN